MTLLQTVLSPHALAQTLPQALLKPLCAMAFASLVPLQLAAQTAPDPQDWAAVTKAAKGQTVYWHAWGGSSTTNAFIDWIGAQVQQDYGVTLSHVKLDNTADAVSRVLNEKTAVQDTDGAVDLIWINGANFAAMKENALLFGPFAEALPNWALADTEGKSLRHDFTVATDGYESPWAMAQVVFMYDTADIETPFGSMTEILEWAKSHPGRFTYPQPPDFLGTTFLKQALVDLSNDPSVLSEPVSDARYNEVTAPLWSYLDALTPVLWRQGRAYPQTGPRQLQLMNDDEIDLAISFSPGEASTAIANFQLPESVRTFVLDKGTIGNASFVAIPYNSSAKEGAMVVANMLLSPKAQLRAQDPEILGYGTVLDLDALPPATQAAFEALDLGVATLPPSALGRALPEPHPSWMTRIAQDWVERYGVGQ